MELITMVDIDFLQQMQDNFALSTGVSCLTEDFQGNAITCPSCFSDCCSQMIRGSKRGQSRCVNCDMQGAEDAVRTGKPAIYQCHAGLIDFAVPIMLEGKPVGAIYGGQVLTEPPQEEKFYDIAVEMDIDPDEYLAAIKKLPVLPERTVYAAANSLQLVASGVSHMASRKSKLQVGNRTLLQAHSWLNSVLETVSDMVFITDTSQNIIHVNKTAEKIIGRTSVELVDKSIKELIGNQAATIGKFLEMHKAYNDIEIPVDTRGGCIYCLSSSRPIKDERGLVSGDVLVLRPMAKPGRAGQKVNRTQAPFHMKDVIGESPEMQEIKKIATRLAKSTSTILLEGESGTGKEVIASAIHNESSRRNGPFIAVNCGAIPKDLINSELFGYVEGAFTGAKKGGNPGKFELASGGTLFLDEIGDMPLEQQVVLLRALQEKQITRVGDNVVIPVDVRIICATNKRLQDEIEKGNFRQDLYYRLNIFSLYIPPLKNRPGDIALLFYHFLNTMGSKRERKFKHIEPEVIQCLQEYSWPGNIRELQNVTERIFYMTDRDTINLQDLPPNISNSKAQGGQCHEGTAARTAHGSGKRNKWREMKAEQEAYNIQMLLDECGGNVSQVASRLNISRNTLYRKINQYNLFTLR